MMTPLSATTSPRMHPAIILESGYQHNRDCDIYNAAHIAR